jgi:hypothetical protein
MDYAFVKMAVAYMVMMTIKVCNVCGTGMGTNVTERKVV